MRREQGVTLVDRLLKLDPKTLSACVSVAAVDQLFEHENDATGRHLWKLAVCVGIKDSDVASGNILNKLRRLIDCED
jgi:hypothetical protein